MARTKELTNIPGLEPEARCVIKKFSYGEASTIRGKAVKLQASQRSPNPSIDLNITDLNMSMLLVGIKEASFYEPGWDEAAKKKFIDEDLDAEAGDYIFNEINQFNSPNKEEIKKS